MAKNKTVETKDSVAAFLLKIKDEKRRNDFSAIVNLVKKTQALNRKCGEQRS